MKISGRLEKGYKAMAIGLMLEISKMIKLS